MSNCPELVLADVLPLVYRFLVKFEYKTAAEALQKEVGFDLNTNVHSSGKTPLR